MLNPYIFASANRAIMLLILLFSKLKLNYSRGRRRTLDNPTQ